MRAIRVFLLVAFAVPMLLVATPGHVAAFCEIAEPPSPVPTQVNGTQVEIQLTEGFARIVIIKEFHNPSEVFKEGQIFFPLEKGHELITDLRLKIGNVVYNSTSQDRGEALDAFLEALSAGQNAALVQYDPARDVYWVAVTIPPRETRTTITTLEMPLRKVDGFYQYDYRLSVDAGHSLDYLRVHVRAATSAPLEDFQIPTHPHLLILRSGSHSAEAYVNSTRESLGGDLQIRFRSSGPSWGQFVDLDEGTRFVRFSLDAQEKVFEGSLRPRPRSFLFLVDASGSMGLRGRWEAAKRAVLGLAEDLRTGETFGLAVFQGSRVTPFFPSVVEFGRERRTELERFLASIRPRGSTSFGAGLPLIERWSAEADGGGQQPILFLISDGRPTRGALGLDLENAYKRLSYDREVPIFALGTEPSASPDEDLLRNLSHLNHGDAFVVHAWSLPHPLEDVLARIRVPVLEGLRTEFPGAEGLAFASPNPQRVWEGSEAFAVARMRGAQDDPIALRMAWADPAGFERSAAWEVAGADVAAQPLVKRQWILTRVHALLESLRAHEDRATVDELKALASANRIVTPYTSLLVLLPTRQPDDSFAAQEGVGLFDGLASEGRAFSPGAAASRLVFLSPLEAEARRAEALRRDLSNPLLADFEVDRYVVADGSEYIRLLESAGIRRYVGTYVTVVEFDDELIGILRDWPAAIRVENGVGLALTVLAIWGLVRIRGLRAARARRMAP